MIEELWYPEQSYDDMMLEKHVIERAHYDMSRQEDASDTVREVSGATLGILAREFVAFDRNVYPAEEIFAVSALVEIRLRSMVHDFKAFIVREFGVELEHGEAIAILEKARKSVHNSSRNDLEAMAGEDLQILAQDWRNKREAREVAAARQAMRRRI